MDREATSEDGDEEMIEPDALVEGDAIELASSLPARSVDMLVTDPPYNISTDFELGRSDDPDGKYSGPDQSHDFGDWDKDEIAVEDWLPLFEPCLTDTAVVFIMYDYFRLTDVVESMEDLGWEPRQPIVWHKQNPIPQGYSVKWQDAAEMGVIGSVNQGQGHHYQEHEGQRHNVISTPVCMGDERTPHPTQKPEGLFEPIFRWWSEPGDVVLDPFMGAGTVPKVASEMGCQYIGIEREEEWFEHAEARVEDGPAVEREHTSRRSAQSVFGWDGEEGER